MTPREGALLIIVPNFPPAYKGGGPIRTIEAMIGNLADSERARVRVVTSSRDHGDTVPMSGVDEDTWTEFEGVKVWYGSGKLGWSAIRSISAIGRLRYSHMYLNGVFSPRFALLPLVFRRVGFWKSKQVIIAPRGELDSGALALKSRKKATFLRVAAILRLHAGVTWHASSSLEAASIRAVVGRKADVVVKENETRLPSAPLVTPVPPKRPLKLVYVGRVSPKKRVHLLLRVVANQSDVQVDVFGPVDDFSYGRQCETEARKSRASIQFHGPIPPGQVREKFAAAHFACFPTAGENFGHVVGEALSVGCPVIIEDVTPWTPYVVSGGGILVPSDFDESWASAIAQAMCLNGEELKMRRALAAESYQAWAERRVDRSFLSYVIDDSLNELRTA